MATDGELEAVKREFQAKGIQTSGGVTLAAGGSGGQFGTFDYEIPPIAPNANAPCAWSRDTSTK